VKQLGGLDIIVLCGSAHNEDMMDNNPPDSAEAMLAGFQLHVASSAAIVQEGIEELLKNKGKVVMVSSAHSIVPFPDVPAYSVAKAAQDALTQTWALKYASKGVRFNSIRPGCVETEGLKSFTEGSGEKWDDAVKTMIGSHPVARIGHPEEQAAAILFLASDASSFITGENLNTDGGAHLGFWLNREHIPQ
jgi:NAD(P)-dependent dehydrogenase (short-subunit alcohol dehydrogenase family)